MKNYPIEKPSSAPATGRTLYEFVMNNIKIPASVNHTIWYEGEKEKLKQPDVYPFRGLNKGWVNLVTLSGKEITESNDARKENDGTYNCFLNSYDVPIFVSDLSEKSKENYSIPIGARSTDKVFNPNFRPYEHLGEFTRISSELAVMSVPKSLSSYLSGVKGRVNYSEKDVYEFLDKSLRDLSSPEMAHLLHGSHMAWCALAYTRSVGNMKGDIMNEFYGQNPTDFYIKDLGSILPTVFYISALLGDDNSQTVLNKIDTKIYGAEVAAERIFSLVQDKKVKQ